MQINNYTIQISTYTIQMNTYTIQMNTYTIQMSNYTIQTITYTIQMSIYTIQMSNYTIEMSNFDIQISNITIQIGNYAIQMKKGQILQLLTWHTLPMLGNDVVLIVCAVVRDVSVAVIATFCVKICGTDVVLFVVTRLDVDVGATVVVVGSQDVALIKFQ